MGLLPSVVRVKLRGMTTGFSMMVHLDDLLPAVQLVEDQADPF